MCSSDLEKFVPTKMAMRKDSCPWISPYLRTLIKKRNRLYRKSKKTGLPGVDERFKQLKKYVQRQLRREHREYVHNLLNDPTEETSTINKRFWTYVKHRRSDCGGLTALRVNNMLVTDSKLNADALNH